MTTTALETNETRTPLRVVVAIIAVSALASLFLCWLVYYHAPADVAGTHLLFLPALNALLNALSSFALVTGFLFYPLQAHCIPPRGDVHGVCFFGAFSRHLHHQSRASRRHEVSWPGRDSRRLFSAAYFAHRPVGGGAADDSHYFFPVVERTISRPSPPRAVHFSRSGSMFRSRA